MNCKQHPHTPAVAPCQGCGAGLCTSCLAADARQLCPDCQRRQHEAWCRYQRQRALHYVRCLLIYGVLYWVGYQWNIGGRPQVSGYMLAAIQAGYQWGIKGEYYRLRSWRGEETVLIERRGGCFELLFNLVLGVVFSPLVLLNNVVRAVYHGYRYLRYR